MPKTREQIMFGHISRWQQSGSSQKDWCRQHNIPYSSFHYWYRQFRNQQPDGQKNIDEGFLPLLVTPQSSHPWCELVFSDGRRLLFHQPVPADFLHALLP